MPRLPYLLLLRLFFFGILACSAAAQSVTPATQLKGLSLEQLLDIKVISASRTLEEWKSAPAAIGVIPSDEIHRSGAVRLADALRLAPGLDVARYVGSSYAISARGFNTSSSNKMQVMLDGRSLYTPLFSGVFWEVEDTLLEDIDRIEVVRGAGATLWGSNAVDGVINIVTKNARDTQGALITAGGGDEERTFGGVRYGGKVGDATYYRAYFKYEKRADQVFSSDADNFDGMEQSQGGFRLDSAMGDNALTLQGDLYINRFGIAGRPDAENSGGNILGRWTHTFSPDSDLQVQTYYDHGMRDVPLQFRENRGTFDLDAQQHFKVGGYNELVVGGDYRSSADDTGQKGRTFIFTPMARTLKLFGGFAQDQITVVPDRLTLFAGSKFEHNDFTGWEVQPNLRLAFVPAPRQFAWAAVSRAVRAPTRVDSDSRFLPNPATGFVLIQGNPAFHSEDLIAYELGYRSQFHERAFADVAVFENHYDHLRTLEPTLPFGAPLVISNERRGTTSGAELTLTFQATSAWRLTGSYSYLHENLRFTAASHDATKGSLEGNDPAHMATLQSSLSLPHNIDFDCSFHYVSRLTNPVLPSYLAMNVRLAFHPAENLEVALVGQNLLDDRHPEFSGGASQPEVQRSLLLQLPGHF